MIVKVRGDVFDIDTLYGIELRDALTEALGASLPGSLKYDREDLETGEPLPDGVEGIDPHIHVEVPAAPSVWPVLNLRVDPDLRTDRDQQDGRR